MPQGPPTRSVYISFHGDGLRCRSQIEDSGRAQGYMQEQYVRAERDEGRNYPTDHGQRQQMFSSLIHICAWSRQQRNGANLASVYPP